MSSDEMMLVAVLGGFAVAIVAIVVEGMRKTMRARGRERSRREIAAYVAAGSMSAEEGVRLMAAGESVKRSCGQDGAGNA